MNPLFLSLVLSLASVTVPSLQTSAATAPSTKKLTYLVVYRPGPKFLPGKTLAEQALKEHFQYMVSLYAKGTMRQAGPFPDNSGGAMLMEAETDAEAKAIVTNDPAVVSGVFLYELRAWAPVSWDKYVQRDPH